MYLFEDLMKWVIERQGLEDEFPSCGQVGFHIYRGELTDGGVQFNLRYGGFWGEADMKIEERRPNVFTVAVAPNGGLGIDYTTKREYSMTDEIQLLREDFPNGRNINEIVAELLNSN